ncbi:MAG: hypothetical protein V1774_11120 [Candidatus Eisenbacteria bacterium]
MRISFLLIPLFVLTLAVAGAQERTYYLQTTAAPACTGTGEATELGCGITECMGYGAAGSWADEIQVVFTLPTPPHGGPWLVQHVDFLMSGAGDHPVLIRQPGGTSPGCPGTILDESVHFAPGYSAWPPADWTRVTLSGSLPPYGAHLEVAGGASFAIGIRLLEGDAIGLVSSAAAEGLAWSIHAGEWHQDCAELSMSPAVRLGLIDLGTSPVESQNWGIIKGLFR